MDSERLVALETRLQRMERRVRLVVAGWVASVVAIAVLGGSIVPARSQEQFLRVRELAADRVIITGPKGEKRILLYSTFETSKIEVLSPDGRTNILLEGTFKGPSLSLRDPQGKVLFRQP